jgi:CBS domain-containing protein
MSNSGMRVNDVMTTPVQTVDQNEPAERAYDVMHMRHIHHLVVTNGKKVVGILSERDLGGGRGDAVRRGRIVADLMTPDVVDASPDTTLKEAANKMRGRSIGCLVVRERGRLRGIVTVTDLLETLGRGGAPERPVLPHRGRLRKPEGTRKARKR